MEFNDRFGSSLNGVNLDTITEAQLATISPLLLDMVNIVRGFSVLIRRKSISEIYQVIINQTDPRIALVLAAARDNSGNQLFPTLSVVKAFMFGTNDDTIIKADVVFNDKSIFVNGIKRVSCVLTASYLIGQLSQVPEQAQHAITLEQQGIADLNRILQVPEVRTAIQQSQQNAIINNQARIYFQPTKLQLGQRNLTVSVYLSAISSSWLVVDTYNESINLSNIISDISDFINSNTLNSTTSNILASLILSGTNGLHIIEFQTRLRNIIVNTELVSIKFTYNDLNNTLIELPFKWGIDPIQLLPFAVNSCLIEVNTATNTTSSINTVQDEFVLDTLYIKRRTVNELNQPIIKTDGEIDILEYRISPTQTEPTIINIPYSQSTAADRPNIIVTELLNSLFELKEDTKALGSIIQNDPTTVINNISALQLVAWTISNKEVELILDVLTLPNDIELAIGNSQKPLTTFSSKPRSLKVRTTYERLNTSTSTITQPDLSNSTYIKLVKGKQSSLLKKLNDIREFDYKSYYNSSSYKDPYKNIPNSPIQY